MTPPERKKKKHKGKGKGKDKLRERHPKQRAGLSEVWNTDGGWDMGGDLTPARATSLPVVPPLLVRSLAMLWHCKGLASTRLLACALDFGCSGDIGVPGRTRHQRFWERRGGPGGQERKRGREDLIWGRCWMSCCYLPSQLHACLHCLALPHLALPCHAFLVFSLFSLVLLFFFINSPGGRMEG